MISKKDIVRLTYLDFSQIQDAYKVFPPSRGYEEIDKMKCFLEAMIEEPNTNQILITGNMAKNVSLEFGLRYAYIGTKLEYVAIRMNEQQELEMYSILDGTPFESRILSHSLPIKSKKNGLVKIVNLNTLASPNIRITIALKERQYVTIAPHEFSDIYLITCINRTKLKKRRN